MNRFDFFFGQYVSQAEMDEAFWWAELADHAISTDSGLTGIFSGYTVKEHAPVPDLTIDIGGPGQASDRTGQRCELVDAVRVLNCAVDEYGVDTVLSIPVGYERWLGIFLRFRRGYSEPKVDRNGVTVYTHQTEGIEIMVRQGTAAPAGTAPRVALLSNALLLADVLLPFGATQILDGTPPAGNISFSRREDWVRQMYGSAYAITEFAAGTPGEAVSALLAYLDAHVSDLGLPHGSGSLVHTWGSTWFGGEALTSATVKAALDEIVSDLAGGGAARVGAADYTSGGGYVAWAAASVQGALQAVAAALDGHIAGGLPRHPASSIDVTPTGWIASVTVQAALAEIVTDLGSQVGTSSGARNIGIEAIAGSPDSLGAGTLYARVASLLGLVDARCRIAAAELVSGDRAYDNDYTAVRTLQGGVSPRIPGYEWLIQSARAYGQQPLWQHGHADVGTQNLRDIGVGNKARDCCLIGPVSGTPGFPSVWVVGETGAGQSYAWAFDPYTPASAVTAYHISEGSGTGTPVACAAYNERLFVLYSNARVVCWDTTNIGAGALWTVTTLSGTAGADTNDRLCVDLVNTNVLVMLGGTAASTGFGLAAVDILLGTVVWQNNASMSLATEFPDGGLACGYVGGVYTAFASYYDTGVCGYLTEFNPASGVLVGVKHPLPLAAGPTVARCHDLIVDGHLLWYPYHAGNLGAACGIYDGSALNDLELDLLQMGGISATAPLYMETDSIHIWFQTHRALFSALVPCPVGYPGMTNTGDTLPGIESRVVFKRGALSSNPGRMCFDGHRIWTIQRDEGRYLCSVPFAFARS